MVATAALLYALIALAAQCGETCASGGEGNEPWEHVRGAWQWTAQFVLAAVAYTATLVAVARATSPRPKVLGIVAAMALWSSWWILFESGLDGIR